MKLSKITPFLSIFDQLTELDLGIAARRRRGRGSAVQCEALAAAVARKQAPVVAENVLCVLDGQAPRAV